MQHIYAVSEGKLSSPVLFSVVIFNFPIVKFRSFAELMHIDEEGIETIATILGNGT